MRETSSFLDSSCVAGIRDLKECHSQAVLRAKTPFLEGGNKCHLALHCYPSCSDLPSRQRGLAAPAQPSHPHLPSLPASPSEPPLQGPALAEPGPGCHLWGWTLAAHGQVLRNTAPTSTQEAGEELRNGEAKCACPQVPAAHSTFILATHSAFTIILSKHSGLGGA